MLSVIPVGLRLALDDELDDERLPEEHRARLSAACTDALPFGSYELELRRGFVAVDWFVRELAAATLDACGSRGADLRRLGELGDSLNALCAKELCESATFVCRPARPLLEAAGRAISTVVWADAAQAAYDGRAHPLAAQAEVSALGKAFSDPRDAVTVECVGYAIGIGLCEALRVGVEIGRVTNDIARLMERLRAV